MRVDQFLYLMILLAASTAYGAEMTSFAKLQEARLRNPQAEIKATHLDRDWLVDAADDDGDVLRLRLTHGSLREGKIRLLRPRPDGAVFGSDCPEYIGKLPSERTLRDVSTIGQLEKLLGPGTFGFHADQIDDRYHSGWSRVCFGENNEGDLVYLSLSANYSIGVGAPIGTPKSVEGVRIRQGVLRPEKLGDKEEERIYIDGATEFANHEAIKAKRRMEYPLPLRQLIETDQYPGDSDLQHLAKAMQQIRNSPDPKLFQQLAVRMDDVGMASLMEKALMDRHGLLELKPWREEQWRVAINACIDALPETSGYARSKLVEQLMELSGGGRIEFQDGDGKGGTSIEFKQVEHGMSRTFSGAADPPPISETQVEFRHRFFQMNKSASDE